MTSTPLLRRLVAACPTSRGVALVAALVPATATAAASDVVPSAAPDDSATATATVSMMVLRENATGSASAAQKYIDDLVAAIGKMAGWEGATGKYVTQRSAAERFIAQSHPQFGILSLSGYLALRGKHKLDVLGKADIKSGGGHQFFVVSKNQLSLASCKGKALGTNHSDATFIDKVVSADDFDLSDFEVVDTRRPVKTLKAVVEGEVECAFIDDAQLMELQHLDGGLEVHPVWSSAALPPMVVAAFPGADPGQRKALTQALDGVCKGEGKAACEATSIVLESTPADAFAEYEKAYGG